MNARTRVDAHLQFALFCDDLLKHWDGTQFATMDDDAKEAARDAVLEFSEARSLSRAALAGTVCTSILQATQDGSALARRHLPRVFQLVSDFEDVRPTFKAMAAATPAWMFLSWTSQLMGMLTVSGGDYFADVLCQMAKEYPQAVYYPFRITADSIQDTHPDLVARVGSHLRLPTLEKFVEALWDLHHPQLRFGDEMNRIRDYLKACRKGDGVDAGVLKGMCERVKALFADRQLLGRRSLGKVHAEFAKQAQRKAVSLLSNASKVTETVVVKLRQEFGRLNVAPAKMRLADLSPWLSRYSMLDRAADEDAMELPGQYTGDSKPTPETHIRIVSFSEDVRCMASLRKPKRLTINGHDQRDYNFLVKGGEDLRLDQRIEQLFEIMNGVFKASPKTARGGLSLQTYAVVPMTPTVGIIEWVDNTATLKSIVEKRFAKLLSGQSRGVSTLDTFPGAKAFLNVLNRWGACGAGSALFACCC